MQEVLDVCLLFAFQMGPTGRAVGVEHIRELVHESIRNVQEDDPTLLSSGRVKLVGELAGILILGLSCGCALALAACRALLLAALVPVCADAGRGVARDRWHRATLTRALRCKQAAFNVTGRCITHLSSKRVVAVLIP